MKNAVLQRIMTIMKGDKLNNNSFSKKIGATPSTINSMFEKETNPNLDTLNKILYAFPYINANWLIRGQGEMLVNYNDEKKITGFYYPNVSAAAGMDKEMVNDELKRIPINLPNWEKGIDFINVYGDSMYPKYCSGEIIGIKEVEIQYVNYGYAYVVILKDEQVLLKFIKKGSDKEHIILESENKFYEPKEYNLNQIKKVFIIKGVITKTTM
jgi:SOS-response transcriptional repressor LexA